MTTQHEELRMAAEHFGNSLVTADSVAPDSAATVPAPSQLADRIKEKSILNRLPCSGFCENAEAATLMMRKVGNDVEATKTAITANIDLSLICSCKACADKHLLASEALEHHAGFLRERKAGNDKGAEHRAYQRGASLRRLGYKLA
jgi:hypothetical protein